jgi:hypothetical protein
MNDNDAIIDPQNSRYRPDLRCNSPYCDHVGPVVELYGLLFPKYWHPRCGLVSHNENDFRPRTGPLSPILARRF